jgi:hypothetical protein
LLSRFVITSIRETIEQRLERSYAGRVTHGDDDAGDSLILLLGSSYVILPSGQACSLRAEVSAGTKEASRERCVNGRTTGDADV